MQYTLKLVTLTRDLGDGSSTTYLYNNESSLVMDALERFNEDLLESWGIDWEDEDLILSKEQEKIILEWMDNDPYKYGCMGTDSIELELVDGKIRLVNPTSIYGNQQ